MNASAAFTASHVVGVPDEVALASLAEFKGTWRRFEHVGMYKEADVYSDYGHHPTAIRGTISAFKEFFPERRLILAFEPHQHSRTHELFAEFATAFDGLNEKDQLIISEIYEVAGRTEAHYESSEDLVTAIQKTAKATVTYARDHASVTEQISSLVKPGDIIVIMGAGPIDNVARKLV
jgi:UDP-N-acetylmuramate--alanine ligase